MKKIYSLLAICMLAAISFSSCSNEEPFATASEDDYPQILLPWFGEWENGEPVEYKSITRDMEFVDSCVVTPSQYTTVKWNIDGETVAEGTRIQKTFLAGTYTLKLIATTTKGLSTSRTGLLVVRPLEGDPTVSSSLVYRQMVAGTHVAVEGTNLENITMVIIGGMETPAKFVNGLLEFDVPLLAFGDYRLVLVDADGQQYGDNMVTIAEEPYEDPDVKKPETIVLWEGDWQVTWGTPFKELAAESKKLVKEGTIYAGTILRVYVEGEGQGAATSAWWRNILTGGNEDVEPGARGDIEIHGSQVLEYELNETSIDLIKNQDGLFVVGNGFNVKKVEIFTIPGGPDSGDEGGSTGEGGVIWEGELQVDWVMPDLGNAYDLLKKNAKAGSVLTLSVQETSASYHMCCAVIDWAGITTCKAEEKEGDGLRGDKNVSGTMDVDFPLNEQSIELIKNGNEFGVVGYGCKLTKITLK